MSDTVVPSETENQMYALIGRMTIRSGNLDNLCAFVLVRLMSVSQDQMHTDVAATILFSFSNIEQQSRLLLKMLRLRLRCFFSLPKHDDRYKAATYMESLLNAAFASIKRNRWARSLAAHGYVSTSSDGPRLSYQLFDTNNNAELPNRNPAYQGGLNAEQVLEQLNLIEKDNSYLAQVNGCLGLLLGATAFPKEFLETANALAPDLGLRPLRLRDPSEGPPMRGKRQRKKM